MGFYEDLEKGLLEAIAIEKGEISMVKKNNMLADTMMAADIEQKQMNEKEVDV